MMTKAELEAEWDYRYQERLGILCECREPTTDEVQLAAREADKAVAELSEKE